MGNFLVYKSSAGSGKTYTLMIEYLTLALKNPSAYRHILAITFTNKAANEIKQRILGNLQKLASMAPDSIPEKEHEFVMRLSAGTGLSPEQLVVNANQVLSSILHHYSDFAVSTIDSFMHRVIRSFAFDLKLSMNFEIELDTGNLLNTAVDELISRVGKDDELTEMLRDYVIRKAEDDENWDITNDLRASAAALFKEKMAGLIPALESRAFNGNDYKRLCDAVKELNNTYRNEGLYALKLIGEAGFDACDFAYGNRGIGNFFTKVSVGKDADPTGANVRNAVEEGRWFPKGSSLYALLAPIESTLIETVKRVSEIRNEKRFVTLIMENFYSTLLLKKINNELRNIKLQRNLISISDFNSIIAGVVKDQPVPFIYLRVGEKFWNFMIDEFQDTSEMQWQNLIPLIENALSDSKLSMLVGDGKQAIYRFKNGNAEQFVNLPRLKHTGNDLLMFQRQQLLAGEYEEKRLLTNYRSRQEIVDFNNAFFSFAADRFIPAHINFYADVKQQSRENFTGGLVNFDFVSSDGMVKKVLDLVEANKAAGYEYGDIAILTRVNRDAVQIAAALQEEGVGVVSSESLLLCSSPQVNFLVNWIAFISNHHDKIAMQGIVEYIIAAHGMDEVSIQRQTDIKYLYELLASLKINIYPSTFNSLSFYDSVELIVREFELGNVNQLYTRFFLDQVLDFTKRDSTGAQGFLNFWNEKASGLSVSIARKKDAVQILTVHKSKGLDFPVVIYAYPDPSMNKSDLSWDNVQIKLPGADSDESDFSMPLVFNYGSGLAGTPLESVLREEEDKISLDKFNLYYVAFTRASERLYVVMPETSKIDNPPKKLSDLVQLFLKERNEGNSFGSGACVEGLYKNTTADSDVPADLNISFKPGEWRNRIILSKRAPGDSPVIQSKQTTEGSDMLPAKTDYGKLVHAIISKISSPDEIEDVVDFVLKAEGGGSAELRDKILMSIHRLRSLQPVEFLFAGGTSLLEGDSPEEQKTRFINEHEIITPEGESYRPDRVVLLDGKTIVVDFKTGIPRKKDVKQVNLYLELISAMGYQNAEGYIVYISEKPEVVSVSLSHEPALD